MAAFQEKRQFRVIVDTSVWIDFFHGRLDQSGKEALISLLDAGIAVITDVIKHELLIGTNSDREYDELNDNLSALEEISIQAGQRDEFNRFGFDLRKKGLLGKYTDASIAFLSKEYQYPIYSFDKFFIKLSQKKIVDIFQTQT